MSLEETDAASRAAQKTPNRIPLAYIESQIDDEFRVHLPEDMEHVTLLCVRLRNGFIVFGKSIPADPENANPELGMKFAREDAIRQLWPLFAFALRCNLTGQDVSEEIRQYAGG